MSNKNLDFVKTKIKDAALTSFRNYNANLSNLIYWMRNLRLCKIYLRSPI